MASESPPTIAEYRALAEFRYQLRRFLRFSEEAARAAGLGPQQYQLLLAIKGTPAENPTVGELAERMQLRHNSAVELLDRLAGRGFVLRQRDQADHRQVRLELTPSAEAVLEQLAQHHRQQLHVVAPLLIQALGEIVANYGTADGTPQAQAKNK